MKTDQKLDIKQTAMTDKIASIKHAEEKRAHIPSQEEAGYEEASAKVKAGKKQLELPKNPVVHRGQDPELFWLDKYGSDDTNDQFQTASDKSTFSFNFKVFYVVTSVTMPKQMNFQQKNLNQLENL